jgi:GR25 family glycosyltransferase involved in LPS biosynthesis
VKSFVITLLGHEYSERVAQRCIDSAFGLDIRRFQAIPASSAQAAMCAAGLRWTWANDNKGHAVCPVSGLKQHRYGVLNAKIGCFMSHYLLWQKCVALDEPILILEHDAVFIRPLPDVAFDGICQINDPRGATPYGGMWSDKMAQRGPGVWPKTHIFPDDKPDGLAGNSAYLIKPWAAKALIDKAHEVGVWPNDALMCRQFFDLQELYPFVTKVEQEVSTTSG